MADIAPKLIHLSAEELKASHERVHKSEANPATIEVHHTILNEMARRKMERPKDDWDKYEILVDSIDNVDLTSLSGLPAETVLDVIKSTGETVGNIKTFFTINGYQMRIESVTKADDSFVPPQSVRDAAQRAIEWIDAGLAGGGFTRVGRTRAGQLARGESVSVETLKRMKSFFSRHQGDKTALGFSRGEKGFPSGGRVAWDAWGGDAGFAWAESMVERYENEMEKHGEHDQADHGNRDGGGSAGEDKGSTGRPALAPDKAPSAERTPKAVEQAEKLRKSSEIEEPKVTSMMEGIVKAIGGEFGEVDGVSSLTTRLKSTESLARKIDADAEKDHEGDREKAAQGISDAIRYTINVDDANYTDGLEKAVKAVEESGWKIRDVKNFWQEGDPYNGVHIKMSKNGVQVEVQLHTPDSHRVKEGGLHDVYDIYRESKDNVERQSLWDSMIKTARTIPTPANAQKLLTVGTLVFQTYETAQQAGLTKSTGVNIIWIMSREGVAVCGILPNQGLRTKP